MNTPAHTFKMSKRNIHRVFTTMLERLSDTAQINYDQHVHPDADWDEDRWSKSLGIGYVCIKLEFPNHYDAFKLWLDKNTSPYG